MNGPSLIHPYEMIPLNIAGYVLGIALLLGHLIAFFNREQVSAFLAKSSRNVFLGQLLLAVDFLWFFLLVAPENMGILSYLRVELADFEGMRWLLQLLCPLFLILLISYAKDLLFPRALGFFCLMVAAPFLSAAYLKDPASRLLIPIWGYAVIVLSLFWVGMPYIYRDMVKWITAKPMRWNLLCIGGMLYGAAVLTCAILWW